MYKKVFIIENKYLANAINYLIGERYYKYTNKEGKTVYSFNNTEKFKIAYKKIKELKQNIN